MTAVKHNRGLCPDTCFGCKVGSIGFAPSAMPTRSEASTVERETKIMHKDVAAYRRLRKNGLQPKSVKGSARLEARANSKWEVETNTSLRGDTKLGKRLDEVQGAINSGQSVI
jgi:hypothetical protein